MLRNGTFHCAVGGASIPSPLKTCNRRTLYEQNSGDVLNPDSYDLWHNKTCETIIEKFSPCAQLKYGQSQKWLNMICKYLCVFEEPHVKDLFRWLHAPIDTIVIERALKVRNISNKAWSKWTEDDTRITRNDSVRLSKEPRKKSIQFSCGSGKTGSPKRIRFIWIFR